MNSIPSIDGPVLETERLVLRPPTGDDYSGFRALIMSDRGRFIGGPLEDEGRALARVCLDYRALAHPRLWYIRYR
ncbi:MAG: hypothetical protein ISP39_10745 [Alphaproteobacteria bacterium]|nr:hypothetical protein [Alphaproteobacteria bacterium]MBL6671634.1 hypothetical protein [Alphaproteobacteria bacterium]